VGGRGGRGAPELARALGVINETVDTHPIHLHLVQFQVEERSGSSLPPSNAEGPGIWKDTVQVHPRETVRLLARFESFRGRFPFHCHILEHEDHEMMRFFETV
jgi:spore coat protein A